MIVCECVCMCWNEGKEEEKQEPIERNNKIHDDSFEHFVQL
jgi:hypothetical protein